MFEGRRKTTWVFLHEIHSKWLEKTKRLHELCTESTETKRSCMINTTTLKFIILSLRYKQLIRLLSNFACIYYTAETHKSKYEHCG